MSSKFKVTFLDDAAFQSVDDLPEPDREVAWDLLDHLQSKPLFGKPLENHPEFGDLADARTLYVIDFDEKLIKHPPPYRIIYRLLPSESDVQEVQVIWAGLRHNGQVYSTATRRLKRN